MKRWYIGLSVTIGSLLANAGHALAVDPNTPSNTTTVNPGVRIGEWISTNVTALFAPVLAVIALYYLVKREFTKFLSFAVFAVLAALFIFGGEEVKEASISLGKWVIGK